MSPVIRTVSHTTASTPRPHILYRFEVDNDGALNVVKKRYSEFAALHAALGVQDAELPPKRILATTFIPSAWVDDTLIAERKDGLKTYLNTLLSTAQYKDNKTLLEFLAPSLLASPRQFDLEDALPSTLSRKKAQELVVDSFPPESLDYSKFDILNFAFAAILKRLVSSARSSGKGTKIVLSVGGWGGSTFFHQVASTAANRATFVSALSSAVSTFGLDGNDQSVNCSQEYPNDPGAGNAFGPADAANLLLILTSLRSALGPSALDGSNGSPLTDMSAYAAQMTYANLMNYDIFGDWSPAPGPNAPLGNLCGTSSQPQYTAEAAFSQWTAAKFPASKLLLGLPLYGYVLNSTKTVLSADFTSPDTIPRTAIDKAQSRCRAGPSVAGTRDPLISPRPSPKSDRVQIPFSSIVSSGALVKQADGTYGEGGGFTMGWDDCSDTPFLFNISQKTVVSYDDTYSLSDKAAFAKSKGMAGCFTWSLDQDDGVTLQNVIRTALGK
ncbi:glycoside hydrolase family 18 protein [Mycena olivaceomarginata]|nr:glycoside hydrolase family 18 protein [Mycena olivaceomarginata]